MFRQLIILHKGKIIFNYTLAKGLRMEEIENVREMLENYIEVPTPGKIFKQPISKNMVYHQGKGSLYFLFVADLVDKLNYFQDIIRETITKFKNTFPIPGTIKEAEQEREKFIDFLFEKQKSLLSKIALIGPMGAGRTTLFNLLKSKKVSPIMNFAIKSPIKLDKLYFELWDFQLDDNYSLLWTKHIGGADLIIFIFDASNYNLKVLNYFLDLARGEGKYSKLLILANKADLVNDQTFKKIKNELDLNELKRITLKSEEAEQNLREYIQEALKLKKKLPDKFWKLMEEAKDLDSEDNLTGAIQKYKELIRMSNNYQNFAHINKFEDRLQALKKRREQQRELEKELKRKKKFSAPQQKRFGGKVKVKSLPTAKGENRKAPKVKKLTPQKKRKKERKLESHKKSKASQNGKLKLTPNDIKINVPRTKKPELSKEQMEKKIEKLKEEKDFSLALQKILKIKNADLSLDLCKQFINNLQESLNRPLTFEDLKIAADKFIFHEGND